MTSQTSHSAFQPGNTAVITGGANGIGLAAGIRYAAMGMNVLVADRDADQLKVAEEVLQAAAAHGAIRCNNLKIPNEGVNNWLGSRIAAIRRIL